MRREDGRESDRVEDRRGIRGRSVAVGGLGTRLLVLAISLLTGNSPDRFLRLLTESSPSSEPGDAEEGLRAAAANGDDRHQRMATGRVQPESWTHGSSRERVEWLRRGLESGDPQRCKAF